MAVLLVVVVLALLYGLYTFNPLSGITGFVKISTTAYAFSKWTIEMKCVVVKANNFTGGGYQQVVPGLASATLTLEQLTYDEGNSAFAVGDTYTFILGYTTGISLTLTVMVESINVTVDIEGGQPVKIVGQSTGSFTAAII